MVLYPSFTAADRFGVISSGMLGWAHLPEQVLTMRFSGRFSRWLTAQSQCGAAERKR